MASLRWLQSIKHEATGSSWILSACVKLFIFCGQWAHWLTTHHWRKADDFWKDMFLTWTTISNRKTFAHYLLHHTIPHHWSMLNGEITQHAKFHGSNKANILKEGNKQTNPIFCCHLSRSVRQWFFPLVQGTRPDTSSEILLLLRPQSWNHRVEPINHQTCNPEAWSPAPVVAKTEEGLAAAASF